MQSNQSLYDSITGVHRLAGGDSIDRGLGHRSASRLQSFGNRVLGNALIGQRFNSFSGFHAADYMHSRDECNASVLRL